MADRRPDEASVAPPRDLSGGGSGGGRQGVVLPPPPEELKPSREKPRPEKARQQKTVKAKAKSGTDGHRGEPASEQADERTARLTAGGGLAPTTARQPRKARLRLVQVEPWSVMKTSFLLSIALAIVTVVAVGIVWGVLGAAGLWDSVNSIVQDTVGDSSGDPFQIQDYLGTSRVIGFTMIVAVADVILITAIATLGAFVYNLAASLLGGIEVTFAEDN